MKTIITYDEFDKNDMLISNKIAKCMKNNNTSKIFDEHYEQSDIVYLKNTISNIVFITNIDSNTAYINNRGQLDLEFNCVECGHSGFACTFKGRHKCCAECQRVYKLYLKYEHTCISCNTNLIRLEDNSKNVCLVCRQKTKSYWINKGL